MYDWKFNLIYINARVITVRATTITHKYC